MNRRLYWLDQLKAVERELAVLNIALRVLDEALEHDPATLTVEDLKAGDLHGARQNLNRTFLLRLFSEFEAALRELWPVVTGRTTRPDMLVLVDRIASRFGVPDSIREGAHHVRIARNAVVHADAEDADDVEPHSLAFARQHLCRYVGYIHHRQW